MTTLGRLGDWIQVHSGGKFWPLDPRGEEVRIDDMAHALSLICRFTGHTKDFYSVAQHSVLVAWTVKRWLKEATCSGCKTVGFLLDGKYVRATRYRDVDDYYELLCDDCFEDARAPAHSITSVLDERGINLIALAGLLHDGSEAYICDIARPVKMLPEMKAYRDAERKVQACIYHAFGMLPFEPNLVKRADNVLLATEARDLLATLHADWTIRPPEWETLVERIDPWTADQAESIFLTTFEELAE